MYALQNDLAQLDNQVGEHFVNSSTFLSVSINLCPPAPPVLHTTVRVSSIEVFPHSLNLLFLASYCLLVLQTL